MPLSPPVSRQLRHRRAIRAEAFERDDGLWDIEACLTDQKPRDFPLALGVRPNGLPIHELWLRITIDRKLNIVDAEASSDWVPYPGHCEASNSAYRALVGLNLLDNFRNHVRRLLAGTAGCTHLTELCAILPTAAIQAFAGEVWETRDTAEQSGQPPFQLDRCHALRFDGEMVRRFYPRWYGHAPRNAQVRQSTVMTTRGADATSNEAAAHASRPAEKNGPKEISDNEVQPNSQTEGNHA
jgi:hypothetical protein